MWVSVTFEKAELSSDGGVVAKLTTVFRLVQLKKTLEPMVLILLGRFMLAIFVLERE